MSDWQKRFWLAVIIIAMTCFSGVMALFIHLVTRTP